MEKLQFNWSEVHDIAEQLEHIDSELLTDRLFAFLGEPTHDPHGEPIPGKQGEVPRVMHRCLDEIEAGREVEIIGVKEDSSEFLSYLDELDLRLNSRLTVVSRQNLDNSVLLQSKRGPIRVSDRVAASILVKVD